ncbi:MAG: hypothetical protein KGJ60_12665, partial [Verrucomicrobiota bacterium]|nr:hypothetical protein [Verrucomicrobiota bacterium]
NVGSTPAARTKFGRCERTGAGQFLQQTSLTQTPARPGTRFAQKANADPIQDIAFDPRIGQNHEASLRRGVKGVQSIFIPRPRIGPPHSR